MKDWWMANWKTVLTIAASLLVALNHYYGWIPREVEEIAVVMLGTVFGIQVMSVSKTVSQTGAQVAKLGVRVQDMDIRTREHTELLRGVKMGMGDLLGENSIEKKR